MRVWHSRQPDEACGLRWLLSALAPWREARGDVLLVELPAYCEDAEDACLRSFRDWGEVNIEYWGRFAKRQRAVSPRLCAALADEWRAVEAENAPLRALVGGRLRSLPEDAYDLSIRRALAEAPREFREGRLIGDILGRYALGVGDGWPCASRPWCSPGNWPSRGKPKRTGRTAAYCGAREPKGSGDANIRAATAFIPFSQILGTAPGCGGGYRLSGR